MAAPDCPRATERLFFRTWRADDLDLAAALWANPEVVRFLGGAPSADAARERLAVERANQEAHGVQYWPFFLVATGEHAGCCGLRPYAGEAGVLELGVHVRPEHWRKGLAREAAAAVIGHAFDVLHVRALFAGHHPGNHPSRALLEQLGFRHVRDELYPPTGLQHPSYMLWPGARAGRVAEP